MKKLTLLLAMGAMCLSAAAQPILVGHRGSGYGLENSEESFKKGIELGYKYLETDVKFSKDLKLVCSHDDDTKRLGGTKTLNQATLEELQSETLSQTRSGVKYTGRLCSMQEYLQICKDGGVGPLIELKWTDGINSNDQSRIPLLIAEIDALGMRDKCIILTSMKPCLEYIRKNYPDIELQFLTGQYWSSHFDWCVQWGIDVDIQAGYFTKETVEKYHDKGLKVNMWTTNDDSGYKTYGNWGCDFITTDRLDGHNLPELNQEVLNPVNTVDYPRTSFYPTIRSEYELEKLNTIAWPAEFAGKTVRRAVMERHADAADKWYVLLHDAEGAPSLYCVSTDGAVKQMSVEGIEGGTKILNDIALTADGKLIGCNLETVTNNEETTKPWKTYVWDNADAAPAPFVSTDRFDQAGNWVNGVIGENFAVSGRLKDLKIYAASHSASGSTYRICGFQTANGAIASTAYAMDNASYTADLLGNFEIGVAPRSQCNIILSAPGKTAAEYVIDLTANRVPMDKVADFALPADARSDAAAFTRYGTKVYSVIPSVTDGNVSFRVYDATDGVGSLEAVCPAVAVADNGTYLASGVRAAAPGSTRVSILVEGQGIFNYNFDPAANNNPVDLGLELERQWILSVSTSNAPEHIDGVSAQQGTAVNGIFYVNNRNEKLLYIFDKTGCIGSIPGGAGYGCTRDDAGNIILRNDLAVTGQHKFMIYPAGAMPDSYETPVELDIECPLEGQTNFINASGNVLGGGGFIYMFSNKQAKVQILAIEDGQFVKSYVSNDLAFEGSTAGYVIPKGNDRENWMYMVRNVNLKSYSGGTSTDPISGRTSTTAPARNSTGGGAYVREGANEILIHNSGKNYVGGFTVRDLSMDKVIANVDPIGTNGYGSEETNNASTFNWIIIERNGKADFTVYQYCPANGIAAYRLYNKQNAISAIDATDAEITVAGGVAEAPGAESIAVYSLDGRMVMNVAGQTADLTELAAGLYIVRASNGATVKVRL